MMAGGFWDTEVYGVAPLAGLEHIEMEGVFDWLGTVLPVVGSKIAWSSVRGDHLHRHFDDDAELAEEAARAILDRMTADNGVEHVGDGLSPYGVRFAGEGAGAAIAALLEVPEHHYFLDEGRAWLVVVTTEGDLDILDRLSAIEARRGAPPTT